MFFMFGVKFFNPKDTRLLYHKFHSRLSQKVLFCDIHFLVPCDICDTDPGTESSFTFQFPSKNNPAKTGPNNKTGLNPTGYLHNLKNSWSVLAGSHIKNVFSKVKHKSDMCLGLSMERLVFSSSRFLNCLGRIFMLGQAA